MNVNKKLELAQNYSVKVEAGYAHPDLRCAECGKVIEVGELTFKSFDIVYCSIFCVARNLPEQPSLFNQAESTPLFGNITKE